MHIVHIITGLNNGGAEGVLYRLCKHDKANKHTVISLLDMGKYGPLLEKEGVTVHCLEMPRGRPNLKGLSKLYRLLKKEKPTVVQTWMYHADLIGGVVARLAGIKAVLWNIRHSTLVKGQSKRSTILVAKICAIFSHFIPKKIICCAHSALEVHSNIGYAKNKMTVIENGYELDLYTPNDSLGQKIKKELNLPTGIPILGMVGRYDPQKDHQGLLTALKLVKDRGVNFLFLLVGPEINQQNQELISQIEKYNLTEDVLLLDQRKDIPALMNALDIHILSSAYGEGFPNVVAEAMACGTPCIATDVGDAAKIVGKTGWIVPPKQPKALSLAIGQSIDELNSESKSWQKKQGNCRERILSCFDIKVMIEKYQKNWS